MKKRQVAVGLGLLTIGTVLGFGLKTVLAEGIPSPNPLYYSGTLAVGGALVDDPARAMKILMWSNPAATAGETALCTTSVTTPVLGGRFRVALDAACKQVINQIPNVYVEVFDGTTSLGRSPAGAVPYAVEADHAVSATNATNASNAADAGHASTADNASYAADAGHASTADNAANATNATNASNAAGALQTQLSNFVDLTTDQTIAGDKIFSNSISASLWTRAHLNNVSFDWLGTSFQIWVDTTNVVTLGLSNTTKTFIISHPTDPDRYLIHATLEGPESAVFYRGSARLRHGTVEVVLPSYFEAATRAEGRTVLVTPTFDTMDESVSSLASSHVQRGAFLVRAVDKNNPNQSFDWEVKAIRSDVVSLVVEPKRDEIVVRGDGPYKYFTAKQR